MRVREPRLGLRHRRSRGEHRDRQRPADGPCFHFSLPMFWTLASCHPLYYGSAIKRRDLGQDMQLGLVEILPADYAEGLFLGRAMAPEGPVVLLIRHGNLHDLTPEAATAAAASARRHFAGRRLPAAAPHRIPARGSAG